MEGALRPLIDKSTKLLSEIDGRIEIMTAKKTEHLDNVRQELAVATGLEASERDVGKLRNSQWRNRV